MPTRENQYVCHNFSVLNIFVVSGQNSHFLSQNVFLQSMIYPTKRKQFIGTSSILAGGKSRVLSTDLPFLEGLNGVNR